MAAAAVIVLIALAFTLHALLSEVMEEHWAAALTAGIFALVAIIAALMLRGGGGGGKKHADPHARAESLHPALDFGAGSPVGAAIAQLQALTKGKPMLLYGAGALAAIVLIRKPGLLWLIGSNLIGMRVQKRRDRKRGMWTR